MRILIDGYNLLHVSGILRRGLGPGSLERARTALLNRLAALLPPEERAGTVIVFDAKEGPRDLPTEFAHQGMIVRFARDFEEADDLLEYLIRTHSAPRQLLVVSSDHRVQKAAKRRKAKTNDSEPWLQQLHLTASVVEIHDSGTDLRREELDPKQVVKWMREFGFEDEYAPPSLEQTSRSKSESQTPGETRPNESPTSTPVAPSNPPPPASTTSPLHKPELHSDSLRPSRLRSKQNPDRSQPKNLERELDENPFPQEYLDELKDLEDLF
jgi:predicted RNA-binding protein with PIN domain